MNARGARKSAFLGMPHGTAANRLRKMVLFSLLERHGENVCFKCSGKIETAGELSIEHKQPWEGVSVELFWSLDNIAFSHLKCKRNHRHASGGAKRRKIGPEGSSWCRSCQAFRDVTEFSRNKTRWNGLQSWCDRCLSQRAGRIRAK